VNLLPEPLTKLLRFAGNCEQQK